MQIPVNTFKHAIEAGTFQLGIWSVLCNPIATEIVAVAGFDWMVIDTEHSPNDLMMVFTQLQAAAGGTAHPVVRIPWNDMVTIKRYLDIGVQTLLIPFVQNAEEARQAVASSRYPPKGVRGFATSTRATRFGSVKDYAETYEREQCVIVQIENREGVDNIESIAAVEGVDALFVGPSDLAASLGHRGNLKHPEVQAVIEESIARIRACGKPAGILISDEGLANRYIELGCAFTAVGSDASILARTTEQLATKFREKWKR